MAKLIYVANMSLDGFVEDSEGRLDWAEPSEEVFSFITDLIGPVGTYLYGRRMYETMAVWELEPSLATQSSSTRDFATLWQKATKIVYSRSLESVSTRRSTVEPHFDPDAVRRLKSREENDMTIGGSAITASAFEAALVDECQVLVYPVILGGGRRAFSGDFCVNLELTGQHRFANGVINLGYRVSNERVA